MTRLLAALAVSVLAACGGGGDEAPADPNLLFSATAPAGSLPNGGLQAGYQVVESFAYTNTSGAPMTVRVAMAGQVMAEGSCDCYAEQTATLTTKYADSATVRSGSAWTDASRSIDVTVPPGATVSGETRIGFYNAAGAVTVRWSAYTVSLRKL